MRVLVVLSIAVLAAGCFNPVYNEAACSPLGECPDGFSCVGGVCRAGGAGDDAATDGPGVDAGRPDAIPPGQCDPVEQAGCELGEKCGRRDLSGVISIECYPNGGQGEGESCSIAADGYDDCRGGLACLGGTCQLMCRLVPDSCGVGGACTQFAGVYDGTGFEGSHGLCLAACDPVTQRKLDGTLCGAGQGCYGAPNGPFTCAPEFNPAGVQGFIPGEPVYINSCAAGYHPFQTRSATDSRLVCSAMCRSQITDASQPGGALGVPGSGFRCPDRDAFGAECRHVSMIQDPSQPGYGEYDDVGYCLDFTNHEFPAGTPMPSCTDLVDGIDTDGNGVSDIYDLGCHPL